MVLIARSFFFSLSADTPTDTQSHTPLITLPTHQLALAWLKLAFHGANTDMDTDTDTDILADFRARIVARMSVTDARVYTCTRVLYMIS